MTTPMQNKLLQALTKSICTTDPELSRQWPVMQQALNQIQTAPFVFIPEGLPNEADAFDNAGRLIISNISYAISSGTELGAPTFIAPAAANNWLGFLKGRRCRNIKGEHAEVDEVGFWVLGRADQTLELPIGTVFSYQVDEDGRYVISGETTNEPVGGGADVIYSHNDTPVGTQPELNFVDGPITWTLTNDNVNDRVDVEASFTDTTNTQYPLNFWCKAQRCWSINGYVLVKRLTAYGGSETGSSFNAYFTSTLSGTDSDPLSGTHSCPNVYAGMTVLCAYDSGGRVVVIDPRAYDAPIGEVKWQTLTMQEAKYVLVLGGTIDMNDASGGTFTLTYDGQTTTGIAYNASPSTVQSALEALSNIAPGDVTIGGSAGAVTYAFTGTIAPLQAPLTLGGGSLTYPNASSQVATITGLNLSGWGPQDGYWNDTTVYGGSDKDWTTDGSGNAVIPIYLSPFPVEKPTNTMAPSGGAEHTHTLTIGYSSTGVTVASHPDHVHYISQTCGAAATGVASNYIASWADTHDIGAGNYKNYSGGALAYAGTNGDGHANADHTALTLSHSVTDPTHSHGYTISDEYQLVNYKTLIPLERVDNSYEKLGV